MFGSKARFIFPVVLAVAALAGGCQAGDLGMTSSASDDASTDIASVDDVVGYWRIADRKAGGQCVISLNRLRQGADYGVHIERCGIAALSKAVAWRPVEGGFVLNDGAGVALARFRQLGVDAFISTDDAYHLDRAPIS